MSSANESGSRNAFPGKGGGYIGHSTAARPNLLLQEPLVPEREDASFERNASRAGTLVEPASSGCGRRLLRGGVCQSTGLVQQGQELDSHVGDPRATQAIIKERTRMIQCRSLEAYEPDPTCRRRCPPRGTGRMPSRRQFGECRGARREYAAKDAAYRAQYFLDDAPFRPGRTAGKAEGASGRSRSARLRTSQSRASVMNVKI